MNNEEWKKSVNALDMLKALHLKPDFDSPANKKRLHQYYISCCVRYSHMVNLKKLWDGIQASEKFREKLITYKSLNDFEWKAEGIVFQLEYNLLSNRKENDLVFKRVRIKTRLPHKEAYDFVVSLAYFIDWCILYPAEWKRDRLPQSYKEHLCPKLLRRYFPSPLAYPHTNADKLQNPTSSAPPTKHPP